MSDLDNGQEAPVVNNEAPETAAVQTDSPENGTQAEQGAEKEPAVERTYTPKELQDIVERATAKAAAKAERRAYREALETIGRQGQQPTQQQSEFDGRPVKEHFADDESYIDALTDWKLDKRDRAANQQRQQAEFKTIEQKTAGMYAQAAKQPGFDQDAFDSLPLTQTIANALIESDIAPKVMAYMAANPDDVERIAKLKPERQAAEIGKIEVRLSTATASKAGPPITPVGSRGSTPVDPEKMTQAQYEKWRLTHR